MFWADKIAENVINTKKHTPYWVDDMFTPSGFAHVGSLRGPLVHDTVFRALKDAGKKVKQTYVFNDFDPIDGLPDELQADFGKYMGFPLRTVPSPDGKCRSFGDYFAEDFRKVLTDLGYGGDFLSSWDMYREGKFNGVIKTALDHAVQIQEIYRDVSGSKKAEKGWLPLQVICQKCGRLGTTRVHDWDGQTVAYTCEQDMVTWARGCAHTGRITPYDGNGKLPWKVDWSAHWKVMGVTIEGAGKDHSSAGGSRDISRALCDRVFGYPDPYNLPYEFFLIGGRKMSSSKGLGLKARDLTGVLPPSVARFLFIRTDYRQSIEFDPVGTMGIPDIFDEYDRCFRAYTESGDANLSRAFVLSRIAGLPPKKPFFLARFRDVANYIQLDSTDIGRKFRELKGSALTKPENSILDERISYARVWLDRYAPDEYRFRMTDSVPDSVRTLSDGQRAYLRAVTVLLEQDQNPDQLQQQLYTEAKSGGLDPKSAFSAIYSSLIGKPFGPKAGWLISKYPKEVVIARLIESASGKQPGSDKPDVTAINRPDLFAIDPRVKIAFPSVSVGIALICGVSVRSSSSELESRKKSELENLMQLKTDDFAAYPEIVSYRKLYRQMGIDWHSRRPSPEALLRRVALGKGLYAVNTCVDAYNLVVMKNRISVGAFDSDTVGFPTVLRFAGAGEDILLLGDKQATVYTDKELAYYDKSGGYNIDFNFRDAQRTRVTESTRNVWINVDGVYDITPKMVADTLESAVGIITEFCGGTVTMKGIVI